MQLLDNRSELAVFKGVRCDAMRCDCKSLDVTQAAEWNGDNRFLHMVLESHESKVHGEKGRMEAMRACVMYAQCLKPPTASWLGLALVMFLVSGSQKDKRGWNMVDVLLLDCWVCLVREKLSIEKKPAALWPSPPPAGRHSQALRNASGCLTLHFAPVIPMGVVAHRHSSAHLRAAVSKQLFARGSTRSSKTHKYDGATWACHSCCSERGRYDPSSPCSLRASIFVNERPSS